MVDPLIIPMAGMAIPIVLVPVILGFRHARLQRELEFRERIKALELGRTLPADESWWSPARLAAAIGLGVPLGSLSVAGVTSTYVGCHEQIWISAGVVGLAGVVSGSILAAQHFSRVRGLGNSSADTYEKPVIDPDAFDLVARRG